MNAVFLIILLLVSIHFSIQYASRTRQFDKSVITWRIDNFSRTSNLSNADVTQVIKNATDSWAAVIPVNFRQSFSASDEIDISIRFLDSSYDDMNGHFLANGKLADCAYTKPVSIRFNGDAKFVIGGDAENEASIDMYTIALHMLGHALGLRGHSTVPGSLMTSTHNGRFAGLSDDVIRDIQELYGVRTTTTAYISTPTVTMLQTPQSSSVAQQRSRRCGRPVILPVLGEGSRIVGGLEAEPHSWPWQASLSYGRAHRCGGVLIDSLHILTAAHCIRQRDDFKLYKVTLGVHDIKSPGSQSIVRGVREIHIHDHFQTVLTPSSIRYHSADVALLRLTSRVPFTRAIKPVCLPQANVASGTICTVTGWGFVNQIETNELPAGSIRSNVLRQVSVPIVPDLTCNGSISYNGTIDQTMLCAGQHGLDACKGDSGGPLVCQRADSRWELQGIVSWGNGCGARLKPGVYARVTYFKRWIEEILEAD